MVAFRLLFCSAAALLLPESEAALSGGKTETTLTDANQCLATMNEARYAADLPKLQKQTLFPQKEDDNGLLPFACSLLLKKNPPGDEVSKSLGGTPAIFEMSEDSDPDCNAAVKEWQSGFELFAANPPVNKDEEYLGLPPKQFSFVSLYNPSPGAVGECQVVLCEEKDAQEQSSQQLPQKDEAEEKEAEKRQQEGAAGAAGAPGGAEAENAGGKKAKALVCLTSPEAFNNKPLFTQQQWDKIAKALSSSTSVAAPSFLVLAAVLSGALLL
ncbi:hypothetical protein Esti_001965 [Eimeria stiedai]